MAKKIKPTAAKDEVVEEKERTTINLRTDIMKNMKFVALFDDKSLSEVMEAAMLEYLTRWENKNGALPQKKV